ncbi:MAG: hypothetical protein AAGF77_05685 [Bacteroidota bacterium]
MLRFWFLSLGLLLASCDYFLSQEEKTQRLFEAEVLRIDLDDVEAYPRFDSCSEMDPKPQQRKCFITTLMDHFTKAFKDLDYKVDGDLNDTVHVDLKIDEDGFITVLNIARNDGVQKHIPNFREEVGKRLNDITTVAPAHKQGIPVSMVVRLPLILDTKH